MNGFMKRALAMMCVTGAIGCTGGERYRNLVDPCQMERYSSVARQEVISGFTPQVQNGRILDQTMWNWYFEAGTDKLNPSGYDKLDQIVRRRPMPDSRIFLATARDLTYNSEKAAEFPDARRELDNKRGNAIQKYLMAQTAGRPMIFDVLVHDPSETGISGVSARGAILGQRSNYSGSLLGASGDGAAQGGGGVGGGAPQGVGGGAPQGSGGGTGAGTGSGGTPR